MTRNHETVISMNGKSVNNGVPMFRSGPIEPHRVALLEESLEDVVEISNTRELDFKLNEVLASAAPVSGVEQLRNGIILHEASQSLHTEPGRCSGYALRAHSIFSDLERMSLSIEALPIVSAYRASALTLFGVWTASRREVMKGLALFSDSILKYGDVSPMPQYLRARSALRLPWYFLTKARIARRDFEAVVRNKLFSDSLILRQRIVSMSYFHLAVLYRNRKPSKDIANLLDRAIDADPDYLAARLEAERLKIRLKVN